MHVLRYKPRYGVNGSTDPTLCNLPAHFCYLSAQAPAPEAEDQVRA